MATRRRPSVQLPALPPWALTSNPPPAPPPTMLPMPALQDSSSTASTIVTRLRRLRQHGPPLPIPEVFMALLMASMGGWMWAAPALLCAGLQWSSIASDSGHARRLSASERARRVSSLSSSVTEAMLAATAGQHPHRIRGRTASARICCICLEAVPNDEPAMGLFECKHDAQTHKACIEQWLERQETCPLCRCDARSPVLEQMRTQPLSAEAQLRGCRFIVLKGWQDAAYQRHLMEVGAHTLVAAALERHAGHEELVAAACGAVFVLAFASREAQTMLARLGVCAAVVEAMARFPNNAEVQSRGCGAIYALALSNKQTQAALCDAGAAGAVLGALRRFMHEHSVVLSAVDAVMALACDFRRGQDVLGMAGEENCKGACELVVELVGRYEAERDVMYAALDAVMKLSIDNPGNRLRFGAGGMCDRVLESLANHGDASFLLVALTALYTMAENQPQNQERILNGLQGEGAALLVSTLQANSDNIDIASVGLDVLFSLTFDDATGPNVHSHPPLIEAGAPAFILRMLQRFPDSVEIYSPGLKAVACLMTQPETQRCMTGPEWCRAVCDCMAHALSAGDVAVVEIACRVVGRLALHSSDNQRALREAGACEVVCAYLRRGTGYEWEVLEATADLAFNCPENRAVLGRNDAVALVAKCIERSYLTVSSAAPSQPSSADETLLDMALATLANLLQDDAGNARRLAQAAKHPAVPPLPALVTRLLAAPHRNIDDERLCIYMMALSILCASDSEAQSLAADAGACEALVGVLESLVVEETGGKLSAALRQQQVLRQDLQLLADLAAGHPGNQRRLREAGALELLMKPVFRCLPDEALDAARWLLAVSLLAEGCRENQDLLVSLGAAEAAMQLVNDFPGEQALLNAALGALASLAANQRAHQDRVGALGACELVVRVVEAHIGHPHFLTRCCSVVLALSELERVDDEGNTVYLWKDASYSNKNRMRECGAVQAFSRAIQHNAADPSTADPLIVSGLILSLALVAEDDAATNTVLREKHGIHALLVRLLQHHPQHDALLTAAGGFMATVCVAFNDTWAHWPAFQTADPEAQRVFVEGGAMAYLLDAMKRRPSDRGTLVMGFIALSALAWQNEAGAAMLLRSLAVLDRMLAGVADQGPETCFYGLMALGAIVSFSSIDPHIVARTRPVIERWARRAAELYPTDKSLDRLRQLILSHISGSSSDGAGAGDKAGEIETAATATSTAAA